MGLASDASLFQTDGERSPAAEKDLKINAIVPDRPLNCMQQILSQPIIIIQVAE